MIRVDGRVDLKADRLVVKRRDKSDVVIRLDQVTGKRFVASPTRPESASLELSTEDGPTYSVAVSNADGAEIYAALVGREQAPGAQPSAVDPVA